MSADHPPTSDKPTVHEALVAARLAIGAVGKTAHNKQANYDFRGIDAVVNAAGPMLAAHGVNVVPTAIVENSAGQIVYGTKNTKSQSARVVVRYTVTGPANDSFPIEAVGEAFDSGDKATPKAAAVAWRTALIQLLMLPTDEPDPDSFTYDGNTGEVQYVDWAQEAFDLTGGDRRLVAEALNALDYRTADNGIPEPDDRIWERVVVFLQNTRRSESNV